ncbi:MAG: ComF family protein [Micavibrio sp.]|nr:ComF family protein [Micavibrio sp.]
MLLPPRCIGSGSIVDRPGMVDPAFWAELGFIENPLCDTCGIPFSFETPMGILCASCLEQEPHYDRARAAVVYNDASRKLVIDFKYGDRLHAVHTFAPWMVRAGAPLLAEADVLIPVPLHRKRLWERRFNQSALLASETGKRAARAVWNDGLLRLRATVPQKGLSRAKRLENVRGAFALNPRYAHDIAGKTVMLVDDVFTSGATLNECARVLKKNGAARVFILTLARVTKEEY